MGQIFTGTNAAGSTLESCFNSVVSFLFIWKMVHLSIYTNPYICWLSFCRETNDCVTLSPVFHIASGDSWESLPLLKI